MPATTRILFRRDEGTMLPVENLAVENQRAKSPGVNRSIKAKPGASRFEVN
jgi:hypothetical protein